MSHKVVFFTGAGISVDSGIPTFQKQGGIRDKLTRPFCLDHYDEYIEDVTHVKTRVSQTNRKHTEIIDAYSLSV